MTVFESLHHTFWTAPKVAGTGYRDHPKTLLATVGTATANLVVLPPAVLTQEKGPLLPPFVLLKDR